MKLKKGSCISVLMPVFNSEKYLAEAIESILHQTYTNFEFLIFDDGSSDNSLNIIKSYHDPRITIFHSPTNVGYVKHLNKGIDIAKGKYIVRMDADDISHPTRFEEQINFMESNPEIGVCGTGVELFEDVNIISKLSIHPEKIKVDLLSYCALVHPTTVIRKSVLEQHQIRYKEPLLYAEDHDFWVQISEVSKLANLPQILLKYRVHSESVTATKWQSHQKGIVEKIRLNQYEALLDRPLSPIEKQYLRKEIAADDKTVGLISKFIKELKLKNRQKLKYHSRFFHSFLIRNLAEIIWLELKAQWRSIKVLFPLFLHFPSLFLIILFDQRFYIHIWRNLSKKWR